MSAVVEEWGETHSLLETEELSAVVPRTRVRTFTIVAGLCAACAAISLWRDPTSMTKVKSMGFFTGLQESEDGDVEAVSCEDLRYIKLTDVVSSNLAKTGPDTDAEEGIIYKADATHSGVNYSHLEIHVHSLARFNETDAEEKNEYDKNYVQAFTHGEWLNGAHGKFAVISVKPNESVKLRVHAYDADKKEDVSLPHGAISFFDLDAGVNGTHAVEHVKISGHSDYWLSNETEVKVSTDSLGYTVFTATKEGNGDDNPKDPTELTVQQKNRAVTVEFQGKSEFNFEIGASAGERPRVFSFVFRPSLLCAKTIIGTKAIPAMSKDAPIVPVETKPSNAYRKFPAVGLVLGTLAAFL